MLSSHGWRSTQYLLPLSFFFPPFLLPLLTLGRHVFSRFRFRDCSLSGLPFRPHSRLSAAQTFPRTNPSTVYQTHFPSFELCSSCPAIVQVTFFSLFLPSVRDYPFLSLFPRWIPRQPREPYCCFFFESRMNSGQSPPLHLAFFLPFCLPRGA